VILDCCYAGAFADIRNRVVAAGSSCSRPAPTNSRWRATASSITRNPSTFAGAFFEASRAARPTATATAGYHRPRGLDYAFRQVQESGYAQTPQIRRPECGDLKLSRSPGRPAELPPDRRLWSQRHSRGPPGGVEHADRLARSADRAQASLAEEALTALGADPDDRVAQLASRAILTLTTTHTRRTTTQSPADRDAETWAPRARTGNSRRFSTKSGALLRRRNKDGIGVWPGCGRNSRTCRRSRRLPDPEADLRFARSRRGLRTLPTSRRSTPIWHPSTT
jgi:hypothetical protein